MKKKLFCIYACLSVFLCGCAKAANRALIDDSERGYPLDGLERAYYDADTPIERTETERSESEIKDEKQRGSELKARIEKIPGVSSAAVVINWDTAIIGVTFEGEPGDREIKAAKKQIRQAALDFDGELSHAAVTFAPELYERINSLSPNFQAPTKNTQNRELFPITPTL